MTRTTATATAPVTVVTPGPAPAGAVTALPAAPAPAAASAPAAPAAVRARVGVTLSRAGGRRAEVVTFDGLLDGGEHLAVVVPPPADGPAPAPRQSRSAAPPLVRLHSECMTGDIFGSARCDCGPQLDESLDRMSREGGVLLYLRQEGRGIGLYNKLDTYVLQDAGNDTFAANRLIGRDEDERDYASAAAMLHTLGVQRIRLLTNNPEKVRQLREHGIEVAAVVPTGVYPTSENARYLEAKVRLGGHSIGIEQRRQA
ncbi:GTP cyclohydrolase II [Streptomyces sp. NPDC012888]|uniref:GTP cyclohydrolase II n=1 Tax=Streptomyces sp. NPDC012888 TaxID=3364855 RepID=UPI0036AC81EF